MIQDNRRHGTCLQKVLTASQHEVVMELCTMMLNSEGSRYGIEGTLLREKITKISNFYLSIAHEI